MSDSPLESKRNKRDITAGNADLSRDVQGLPTVPVTKLGESRASADAGNTSTGYSEQLFTSTVPSNHQDVSNLLAPTVPRADANVADNKAGIPARAGETSTPISSVRPLESSATTPLVGGPGDTRYTPNSPGGNSPQARSFDAPFVPSQQSPGSRQESVLPNSLNQADNRVVPSRPSIGSTDAGLPRDVQPAPLQNTRSPMPDYSAPRSGDSVAPKVVPVEVRSGEVQPQVAPTTTSIGGVIAKTVSADGNVKFERMPTAPASLSDNQPVDRNAPAVSLERNAVTPSALSASQDGPPKVAALPDVGSQPRNNSTNSGELASASFPAKTQVERNDISLPAPQASATASPLEGSSVSRPVPANAQDGQNQYRPASLMSDTTVRPVPASSDAGSVHAAPADLVRLQNPGTTSLDAQRLPSVPGDTKLGNSVTGDSTLKPGTASSGTPDAFGARKETGIQLPDARQTTGRADSSVQLPDTKQSTTRTDTGAVSNPGAKPDGRIDSTNAKLPDPKTLSALDQKFGDKINPPGGGAGIPVLAPGLPDIFGGLRGDKDSRGVKDSKVDPAVASDSKDVRGQLTGAKDVKDGRVDLLGSKDTRGDLSGAKDSKTPDGKLDNKSGASVDDRIIGGQKTTRADGTEAGNRTSDAKTPQDNRTQANDGRLAPDGRPVDGRQQGGSNLVHDGGAIGATRTDQSGARIVDADGKLISGRVEQGNATKNDGLPGGKGIGANPGGDKPFILPPGSLPVPDLVGGIKNIGQQIDARTAKPSTTDDAGKNVKHADQLNPSKVDGVKPGAGDTKTTGVDIKAGATDTKGGAGEIKGAASEIKTGASGKTGGSDIRTGGSDIKTSASDIRGSANDVKGAPGDIRGGTGAIKSGADGVNIAGAAGVKIGVDGVRTIADGVKSAVDAVKGGADGVRTVITGGVRTGDIRNNSVAGADRGNSDNKSAIAGGAKPGDVRPGENKGDGVKTAITGGAKTTDTGSPLVTGGAKISDGGRPVITGEPNDARSGASRNPLAGKSDVGAAIPSVVPLGEMIGNLKAIAARIFPPESLVRPFDTNLPGRRTEKLEGGSRAAVNSGLRAESAIPIIRVIGETTGRADEKFVIKLPQSTSDANAQGKFADANAQGKFADANAQGKFADAHAQTKLGDASPQSKLNDATAASRLPDGKVQNPADNLVKRELSEHDKRADLQHLNAKAADTSQHGDKHEVGHDEAAERMLSNLELVGSIESVGAVEMEEEEVFPLAAIEYFGGDFEKSISDEDEVSFDGDGKVVDDDEQSTRYQYIVEAGDTVELIAIKVFKNLTLAPLIYEINKDSIPIGMQDGRMVFMLKVGMIIWLPFPKEVKEYMQRLGGASEL